MSGRRRGPRGERRYDLVIIGGGPAGLAAAEFAAHLGGRVALIESRALGGTSLHSGSVPSKALVRAATLFAATREGGRLQRSQREPRAQFGRISARLRDIEERIGASHSAARLERLGIELHHGSACFSGLDSVRVRGTVLRFHRAIVATGAQPAAPGIPGLRPGSYHSSESIFGLTALPRQLAVVGGGPLGCELAQAFCRLGSRVTIIQDEAKFLPREERDAAQLLAASMARDGVDIRLNTRVVGAEVRPRGVRLQLQTYRQRMQLQAQQILVSVGRVPRLEGLQLEAARIAYDRRRGIRVDDYLRTSNPRVYAAGDVCLQHKYTHVAESTGRLAACNALHRERRIFRERNVPWCTFCAPEIAHIGLQVWEARRRGIPLKTYTVLMHDVDRAITDRQDVGFVKLHATERSDRILGATIVAARASEMINEVAVAMDQGVGLRELARVLHTYPSQSSAIRLAAMSHDEGIVGYALRDATGLAPR
ncbi:MAG: FAD-dependent oxidoreductase [Gammaproteobacteria bacterium]|nr:FAD-dependent oxidoreductase [Gammaproteobacteria bacterium]